MKIDLDALIADLVDLEWHIDEFLKTEYERIVFEHHGTDAVIHLEQGRGPLWTIENTTGSAVVLTKQLANAIAVIAEYMEVPKS